MAAGKERGQPRKLDPTERARIDAEARSILERVLGVEFKGRGSKARCPDGSKHKNGDANPSFSLKGEHGRCFTCGLKGDVLDLVMQCRGVEFSEALALVRDAMGISRDTSNSRESTKPSKSNNNGKLLAAFPEAALDSLPGTGPRFVYRDDEGRGRLVVVRVESGEIRADGRPDKVYLPWTYRERSGSQLWRSTLDGFANQVPLYGLHELAKAGDDAVVLLVEGEKTADAARERFHGYVAMTWQGGSGAAAKADLEPLRGRRVVIWPDADDKGQTAARAMQARLLELDADARVVELPDGLPAGWDLADLAEDSPLHCDVIDTDQAHELIRAALEGEAVTPDELRQKFTLGGEPWPEDYTPLDLPEYESSPPFPLETLPRGFGEVAKEIARATQSDPAIAAATMLGDVSYAISKKWQLAIRDDWVVDANAQIMIVGATATTKSPAFKSTGQWLDEYRREYIAEFLRERQRDAVRAKRAKSELAEVEKRYEESAYDATLKEPVVDLGLEVERLEARSKAVPAVDLTDLTMSAMVDALAHNDGRLLIRDDEGTLLAHLTGRHQDASSILDLENFNKACDGMRVGQGRRKHGQSICEKPCLTSVIATHPPTVKSLRGGALQYRGVLGRFLFVYANPMIGQRRFQRERTIPEGLDLWRNTILELARLPVPPNPEQYGLEIDGQGFGPAVLRLSGEALDAFENFYNQTEIEAGAAGGLTDLVGYVRKLHQHVARLMLVLHAMRHGAEGSRRTIELHTANAAITLGRYFLEQARLAYGLIPGHEHEDGCRRVVATWREKLGTATTTERDLFDKARCSAIPDAATLRLLLEHMRDAHNIAAGPFEEGTKSKLWQIRPEVFQERP